MSLLFRSVFFVVTLSVTPFLSIMAADMQGLKKAGVDIQEIKIGHQFDIPVAPHVIKITNRSTQLITYDPALIAEYTINSPVLYDRFKKELKKWATLGIILNTLIGSGFFALVPGRSIIISKRLPPDYDSTQGDESPGFFKKIDFKDLLFMSSASLLARYFLSNSLVFYRMINSISIIDKKTTIKPLENIQFFIWPKNISDDPVFLIYLAMTLD